MNYKYICYLAGPITGESFAEANDWREKVKENLDSSIVGMSPLRGKNYLSQQDKILSSYESIALSSGKGITTRDHNDCKRSDMLLVNLLGAKMVSIGTVMEIAWAYAYGVPTVVVMEEGNIHHHVMIRESVGFVVDTLEEATHIVNAVLTPEPACIPGYEDLV